MDAKDDHSPFLGGVSVEEVQGVLGRAELSDNINGVSVHIPYFGVIKISPSGVSKVASKPQPTTKISLEAANAISDLALDSGAPGLLTNEHMRKPPHFITQHTRLLIHLLNQFVSRASRWMGLL